jgi:hypothetical protein
MPRYAVYGSVLESAIEIPELNPAPDGAARWRVEMARELPPMREPVLRGEELIYGDVHARLHRHADGLRISVDDTGAFDLHPEGDITLAPKPGAWDDFVRAHLLGRVLATALFEEGLLPLHGSAVETREGVIAFLAPKGFGKSTLALALAREGAPLLSDDTFPVQPTTPPLAWPGVHSVRVGQDAIAALALPDAGRATREGKRALHTIPGVRTCDAPRPLAGIFLLAPTDESHRDAIAVRTPFSPTLAAAALIAHVKIGRMLGRDAAALMLERAARIVHLVPVHQLSLTRDLNRLSEAARTILSWYGGPPR